MSKAGRKIIKGAKEALAVARGEIPPFRVSVRSKDASEGGISSALQWLDDIARNELYKGRKLAIRIEIEFPPLTRKAPAEKKK